MRAIEVSAVFEDAVHLRLAEPVREVVGGPVKVIVLFPGTEGSPADGADWPPGFIDATYGVCHDDPLEPPAELPYEKDRLPLG